MFRKAWKIRSGVPSLVFFSALCWVAALWTLIELRPVLLRAGQVEDPAVLVDATGMRRHRACTLPSTPLVKKLLRNFGIPTHQLRQAEGGR